MQLNTLLLQTIADIRHSVKSRVLLSGRLQVISPDGYFR